MDNKTKLHDYIGLAYDCWVEYAARYIRRSKLPMNPSEVVNDILCTLLERDVEKLYQMMERVVDDKTELDFFVMCIIKTSIYSPRSPFRYQRGQHCTCRLKPAMSVSDDPIDSHEEDIRTAVWSELSKMNASEFSKKVFIWKFFDGNPISKWPGRESPRVLYRAYNRVLKKIIARKVVK